MEFSAEDFASYAPLYRAMARDGYAATAGGAAAIAANADRYEPILDPFVLAQRK